MRRWTDEEDAILRENYKLGAEKCAVLLDSRSVASVIGRARYIGLASRTLVRWTESEEKILIQHYPEMQLLKKLLPHRTVPGIRGRASQLGLFKKKSVWTIAEVRRLQANVRTMTRAEVYALFPNRVPNQVDMKMCELGLKAARRPYGLTGMPLLDAIRQRCFENELELTSVGRKVGNEFALYGKTHKQNRTIESDSISRAISLLGGELYVEWDD